MKWFHNLSLWFKVMSIAVLGLFGFSLYLGFTYLASQDMGRQVAVGRHADLVFIQRLQRARDDLYVLEARQEQTLQSPSEASLLATNALSAQLERTLAQLPPVDRDLSPQTQVFLMDFRTYASFAQAQREAAVYGRLPGVHAITPTMVRALGLHLDQEVQQLRHQAIRLLDTRLAAIELQSRVVWVIGLSLGGLLAVLLLLLATLTIRNWIVRPLQLAAEAANRMAQGDFAVNLQKRSHDELGRLMAALIKMRDALARRFEEDRRAERVKGAVADLTTHMRGDLGEQEIAQAVLNHLVPALRAQVGLLYSHEDGVLALKASYALVRRKNLANTFRLGESLVGQAALERQQILVEKLPDDYLSIASGMGETTPRQVIVTPIVHEGQLQGVLEIGALQAFDADDLEILRLSVESIAIALATAISRQAVRDALAAQQGQARLMEEQQEQLREVNEDLEAQAIQLSASESKLQQQQEELRHANGELEAQAQALRASEESLQAQQEELRVINEELEAQARLLAEQRNELLSKNEQLERTQELMEEKNRLLEQSSRYKSEFLSTMSHELRTPLNSILILSNSLAENRQGNLQAKQVEHAQVIHSAGSDLLSLINDILDIAKVEEGKMHLVIDALKLSDFAEDIQRGFAHVAQHKGLRFQVELAPGLPECIYTDRQRLEQILRNFFSNAFKFTHQGGVTLRIHPVADASPLHRLQQPVESLVAFSCIDTGIGVPAAKQELIFEAFQQADGTTSRKYGGTGLGLTISRELSYLLGGEVRLFSAGEGQGCTFTLYLPQGHAAAVTETAASRPLPESLPALATTTMVSNKAPNEPRTLLVVDDDVDFAQVLVDLARDYHFRTLIAHDGETALVMAREFQPDALILDLGLPGIDGLEVMRELKADPATANIPVHILSGHNERDKALGLGAQDYLMKPVDLNAMQAMFSRLLQQSSRPMRKLLVVEDSNLQNEAIIALFAEHQVEVTICASGEAALATLAQESFDCMILDLSLPDTDGFSLLEKLHEQEDLRDLPIIVYTGRDLSREEEARLRRHADRIILKTERSAERLLSEVSLFLHWIDSQGRNRLHSGTVSAHRDALFTDRRILVVDDDMRNIYALSAGLEEWGCQIRVANNGKEALQALAEADYDLVLMDIMMPEMDGYEAMRRLRADDRWRKLPVIALTAKAMKEDRNKCLEAGANDYIAKPINMDKLQSLMRVWLQQRS